MSLTFNGSTSNLQFANKLITAYPFSMFAWVKPRTLNTDSFVFSQGSADKAEEFDMYNNAAGAGKLRSYVAHGGGVGVIINSTSSMATTWQPALIVHNSATSCDVYYAGGAKVSGDTGKAPTFSLMTKFMIGARAGDASFAHDGEIAEVALWSSALAQADFDLLAAGSYPETVQAASLIDSWPLQTQASTHTGTKGTVLTNGASTTQGATHPFTRAADTTGPVLSSPTGTATGPTTASGTVSTNENGTLYRLASTNATESAATIKAAALTSAVTSTGVQTVSFTGLSASTTYYPHYYEEDGAGNPSNVVNGVSFTTAAANAVPTFAGTIANITGTGGSAITPADVHALFSDTDTLTYSASPAGTAWPAGLVVNATTGIISGTVATSTTTGLKVRATDTASQTVDSNAFSVTISAPASSVTSVSVTPATATVAGGATQTFTASVAGTGSPSQAVNWSRSGSAGSINASGVFTAPASTTASQTITITATSAQDGTKSGTATVTVPAVAQPTFTPTAVGKTVNGPAARTGVACRVAVYDKATDALVGVKTGLTSTAGGLPPPFQLANGAVSGTEYLCKVVADTDHHDLGFFFCTPA
jgi:hypothetical protein